MSKNRKVWTIVTIVALLMIASVMLILFRGRKPLKNVELVSATVQLMPPDKTIQVDELDELEDLLEDIVIYNRDNSYTEYAGQAVVFSITMLDGSQMEVTAYNPFVIIDGVGYKCKYEPCEELNDFANELLNSQDYFDAVVTQVHDNYILAECTENASGAILVGTEVSVSNKNISSEEFPELEAGDHIRVVYAGEILEKDPPGFQQIISVFAVGEDGSIVTGDADGERPELPNTDDEGFPNWGLTLSVKNVSASGLTLICTQSGGELTGELETGSDYHLIVLKDGTWQDVPTIIAEYGWTAEAYMVPKDDSVEFEINWEWLYGKLPPGTYRITKGFMDFRGSGDYDNFAYWTEFEIK